MRALADGRVQAEGIESTSSTLSGNVLSNAAQPRVRVAELSLHRTHVSPLQRAAAVHCDPVFPSRMFAIRDLRFDRKRVSASRVISRETHRHGRIPDDRPVWIRGILQDEYRHRVTVARVYTGGMEEPGRERKLKLDLPDASG
jgi:4,5-dihydroxyphthalate decarboxylase